MKIVNSVLDLVGHTPLIRLGKLAAKESLQAEIVAKIEMMNPAGSVKDRIALHMVERAEAEGILRPGMTIVEPTSGNTGIGLALVGRAKGYQVILVMPETMSIERRQMMTAYGAELELTPGALGMQGAVDRASEMAREDGSVWVPQQFRNPDNAAAHMATTAAEIWEDTDGEVDVFVAGIGTGGTVTGVGTLLKEKRPHVQIIGVEPASSPLLTEGVAGPHRIQGIGANFVPDVLRRDICDEIIPITDEIAVEMTAELARTEGLLVGISSGAAVAAALQVAKRPALVGKRIVVLLPDTGMRYLSSGIYEKK